MQEGEEHLPPAQQQGEERLQGQQADGQQDPDPGAAPGL